MGAGAFLTISKHDSRSCLWTTPSSTFSDSVVAEKTDPVHRHNCFRETFGLVLTACSVGAGHRDASLVNCRTAKRFSILPIYLLPVAFNSAIWFTFEIVNHKLMRISTEPFPFCYLSLREPRLSSSFACLLLPFCITQSAFIRPLKGFDHL